MRYQCVNGNINQGVPKCISFGGVRVDQAVASEVLRIIEPMALDAALQAAEHLGVMTRLIQTIGWWLRN
jgi:hypothetical protein